LSGDSRILVFDDKAQPADVARGFKHEVFAGPEAGPSDRRGYIP
jgi:hypothetical protein